MTCSSAPGEAKWYALYVMSRHEKRVAERVAGHACQVFLPLIEVRSRRKDRTQVVQTPLLTGYVFVQADLSDGVSRLEIKRTLGVLHFVAEGHEPIAIPPCEIESLQILVGSKLRVDPYAFLQEGRTVKIVSGPLKGAVGILVEKQAKKHRFVVSVSALGRSVATTIDACDVRPYDSG